MSTLKGIILAGGRGTRLRPLTYSGPKQLVEIGCKPVLCYVIDHMIDAGIDINDIIIVTSHESYDQISETLRSKYNGGKFSYVLQPTPSGIAHAIKLAVEQYPANNYFVSLGDNITQDRLSPDSLKEFIRSDDVIGKVFIKKVPDPEHFGVAIFDTQGRITSVIEKPRTFISDSALIGNYLLKSKSIDYIYQLKPSKRGEYEITDAIQLMIDSGENVNYSFINGWWLDTGKKDDIILANKIILSEQFSTMIETSNIEGSILKNNVIIRGNSTIKNSHIIGPVVIEDNVTISDSIIGPDVSVSSGVQVHSSVIENSMLYSGSTVENIKLTDSIIGKHSIVKKFDCQISIGKHKIFIGDHCIIEL